MCNYGGYHPLNLLYRLGRIRTIYRLYFPQNRRSLLFCYLRLFLHKETDRGKTCFSETVKTHPVDILHLEFSVFRLGFFQLYYSRQGTDSAFSQKMRCRFLHRRKRRTFLVFPRSHHCPLHCYSFL